MSAVNDGFLALRNRYIIEGALLPQAALHVGSGAGNHRTDSTFLCDALGPLVPGSSLRGVLRSTLERILQTLGGERGCVLFCPDSHGTCLTVHQESAKALSDEQLAERVFSEEGLCDLCRLFGSPYLASRLRVADCRPRGNYHRAVRDGVGIDRDTETAREKIKYDFEALEFGEGATLDLRIEVENATVKDFALLRILLDELKSGIDLGGRKSSGLGRCKLNCKYRIFYFDCHGAYTLTDFLTHRRPAEMPREQFDAFTAAHLARYLQPAEEKEQAHAAPDAQ